MRHATKKKKRRNRNNYKLGILYENQMFLVRWKNNKVFELLKNIRPISDLDNILNVQFCFSQV